MAQQGSSKNGRGRKRGRNDNGFEVWGGYMSAKISKLEGQCKEEGSGNEGIFSGIAIFVNGYTEPSGEELKRIMLSNGGTFHHYYSRRRTTHIIASNLPHTKVRHLDTDRIVKASWIVESLAAGRLLDYSKYLLYTDQSSVQPKISFSKLEKPTRSPGCTNSFPAVIVKPENRSNSIDITETSIAASGTGIKSKNEEKLSFQTSVSVQSPQSIDSLNKLATNFTSNSANSESNDSNGCILKLEKKLRSLSSVAEKDTSRAISPNQPSSPFLSELYDEDLFPEDKAVILGNSSSVAGATSSESGSFKAKIAVGDDKGLDCSLTKNFKDSCNELHSEKNLCRSEDGTHQTIKGKGSCRGDMNSMKRGLFPNKDLNVAPNPKSCEKNFNTHSDANECNDRLKSEHDADCVVQGSSSNSRLNFKGLLTESANISEIHSSENGLSDTVQRPSDKSVKIDEQKDKPNFEYDYPSNTSNPNFLADFYNKSRLHHISTMGATFKEYVTKLIKKPPDDSGKRRFKEWLTTHQRLSQENSSSKLNQAPPSTPGNARPPAKYADRLIMHIDMDCFFVSVGLRNRPDLVGKPVAVTHARGNRAHKRPGADINAEFQLYKERRVKKNSSLNVDPKIASKIRELEASKTAVAGGAVKDPADDDEGYEAWSDIDEQEEALLLEALEQVEDKSTSNTTQEIAPGSNGDSSNKNDKKKVGKHGTGLLDSTSSLAEIASCSYEARQAGVTNGMFLGAALKLCPQLQTIPYDFEGYKQVSFQLYDIVASYTRSIEAVSCDELYADVSEILKELRRSHGATPELLAACVRDHVTSVTKCGCSAGLGHTKLASRLATKLAKPHGHVYLSHTALLQHLTSLPLRDLPGVGWSVSDRLRKAGAETCGELREWTLARLEGLCGPRTAATLLNFCNGIDDRPIISHHVRKSVSAEVNYGIRFERELDAKDFLRQLCEEVSNRLKAIDLIGRCLCLKLKIRCKDAPRETAKFMGHGVCDNVAKSVSLLQPTDDPQIFLRESLKLLSQVKAAWCDYRGVGLQVSRLEAKKELDASPTSAITKFLVKKSKEEVLSGDQPPSRKTSDANQPSGPKPVSAMEKFLKTETNNSESTANSKVVDVEVLLALPPDLREQVIAEYKQQGYIVPSLTEVLSGAEDSKKNEKNTSDSAVLSTDLNSRSINEDTRLVKDVDLQTPGPSGYRAFQRENEDDSRLNSATNSLVSRSTLNSKVGNLVSPKTGGCGSNNMLSKEEPSVAANLPEDIDDGVTNSSANMSQIDSSFLCALPEDLQEELKRDYQRQKRVLNGLTSPKKLLELSPSKAFAGSPPRGSPRRPRGRQIGSPRRLPINTSSPPRRGRRRGRPPKWDTRRAGSGRPLPKASVESCSETSAAQPSDHVETCDTPLQPEETPAAAPRYAVPSLCGESTLPSVRSLIKEWLEVCPVPGDEDCAILSEYFSDLAAARQLEMVDCLVKLLYRKIGRLPAPCSGAWRAVYAALLQRLQAVMVREYGAPLLAGTFETS